MIKCSMDCDAVAINAAYWGIRKFNQKFDENFTVTLYSDIVKMHCDIYNKEQRSVHQERYEKTGSRNHTKNLSLNKILTPNDRYIYYNESQCVTPKSTKDYDLLERLGMDYFKDCAMYGYGVKNNPHVAVEGLSVPWTKFATIVTALISKFDGTDYHHAGEHAISIVKEDYYTRAEKINGQWFLYDLRG